MSARIVLAAGGTGGHVFPAQSVAEGLRAEGCEVTFITDTRSTRFLKGVLAEVPSHVLHAGTFVGGIKGKVLGAFNLLRGVIEAVRLLRNIRPECVVGFGGYPAFPAVFAAQLLGIKTALHEQNAVLGRANRLLAKRAKVLALSFENTARIPATKAKIVVTGNPVRASIRALCGVAYAPPTECLNVLITGGSQGASIFSSVVPEAVALLPEAFRRKLHLTQQCRAEDVESLRARYAAMGVQATLAPFFEDMPALLSAAHVAIGRAGASTIAETMVAGKPAILVPLPSAMDDHQTINAKSVEAAGAGWLVPQPEFTPERLAELLQTPEATLATAAANTRKVAKVNALEELLKLLAT